MGCRRATPTAWYLALALIPAMAGGCDDSPTDTGPNGAVVSVYLKDAPGDVDNVWVQVDDVVLQGDAGPVSLLSEPTGLVNLTELAESAEAINDGEEIEPGTFSEVRLVLGGAVLESGANVYTWGDVEPPEGLTATGTLQCPSCSQSGLKVKFVDDVQIEEGENGLLLDFDVSQSFGHQAGQSGMWVMHPVIHGAEATPTEIEAGTAAGTISGAVALATDDQNNPIPIPACGGSDRTLEAFVPTATATTLTDEANEPLVFTGETSEADAGFGFGIDVTDFDTYTLGYAGETVFSTDKLVWTADVDSATVTVDDQHSDVTDVTYTVTAVTCEAISP